MTGGEMIREGREQEADHVTADLPDEGSCERLHDTDNIQSTFILFSSFHWNSL